MKATRQTAQYGQATVEFVIIAMVLFTLLLGIFQMTLVYRAKATLDYAAYEAVRSGATSHASQSAMREGLARGLMALYAHSSDTQGAVEAYAKARLDLALPIGSTIEIISPTQAAFDDFAEAQDDQKSTRAIPNDTLAFRSRGVGSRSGMNVQDANLLKVRVVYGYPLVVPFIGDAITGWMQFVGSYSAQERLMLASGRLPIEASATVRMQSAINDRTALPAR
ncbi:pilus assembly protein [Dyella solisilvae]|uniref:Pilus assembly protein n=1 Tax=Dyella solisilvae TaxID=1920168 RepID=A0A370K7B8_9GAMM|nr:TadE family protein [Dyella solisilvae]RDI98522.1 pilus assembly protein [Dyella solisilvae]